MITTDDGLGPRRTTHEWVRERLRHDIVTGVHTPGSLLKQTELAASLRVSVTPIREAMRDLVAEGFVVVDPQRVARVRDADPADAAEIFEMRHLLEPLAARLAAERARPEDVATLRQLAAAVDDSDADGAWLSANHAFHMAVIAVARSPRLELTLVNLRQMSAFFLGTALRRDAAVRAVSSVEHAELVTAVAVGDGEAAAAIMKRHLLPAAALGTRRAGVAEQRSARPAPKGRPGAVTADSR